MIASALRRLMIRLMTLTQLLWRFLPDAAVNRLLRGRGWGHEQLSVAVGAPATVRLFVAPTNSAGQGWAWARAVERSLPSTSAFAMAIRTPGQETFAFPADQRLPETAFAFANQWRKRQRSALINGFTHVLVESGRFPFGNVPGSTPREAWSDLTEAGLSVALVWHGSDIRMPSQHVDAEPDSPFASGGSFPADRTVVLERNARTNLALIESCDYPVFVSTPDLLPFAPGSVWLPCVIDVDLWQRYALATPMTRAKPVVVHAPSSAGLKGTEEIRPIMRRLHEEGLVEYRELSGLTSAQMPAAYGEADIVLDQFLLGIYGVAANEALAAGRIVVSHVGETSRAIVKQETGFDLPIVEARIRDLEGVIRDVVARRSDYAAAATVGPEFVRAVHDGRRSAEVLSAFLGTPTHLGLSA